MHQTLPGHLACVGPTELTAAAATQIHRCPLPQVQGLLSGILQFAAALASPSQLAAAEPGAAAAAGAAAVAAFSCTRVVAFLQLAIGCMLPTALYLWSEGELARQHVVDEQVRTACTAWCASDAGRFWSAHTSSGCPHCGTAAPMLGIPSRTHPPHACIACRPIFMLASPPAPAGAHERRLGAAIAGVGWHQACELAAG